MTIKFANRVKVSTSTTGTGTITLGSAVNGFQTFSQGGILNGESIRYTIINGNEWEVGTGVYTHSGTTMSRSYEESSTGSLLNLAGDSEVFITVASTDIENIEDTANNALPKAGGTMTGDLNLGDDTNVNFGAGPDLRIFSNGTRGEIRALSGTKLMLRSTDSIVLQNTVGSADMLEAVADAGVTLFYDSDPKIASTTTGAAITGSITVSGTVDGVDIATRDGVLTTTTTTANAALPKAGGTMTGVITFAAGQAFDGRDVSADGTKLDGIESGATADQTDAQIKTAYENNSDTNAFTDAEKTKLSGIETSADVTDTTNVTAAGALMDSELTNEAAVKAINQGLTTTSDVTFNDVVVSGDLTVSGTTTTINTETINLADNQIVLNSNETGSPTQDGGIEIERGTETNKTLVWDETNDRWTVGSETFVAGFFSGDGSNLTNVAASTVNVSESTDDNALYNVLFSDTDGSGNIQMTPTQDDGGLTYNPSNDTLTTSKIQVADSIVHKDDTNTYIDFSTDAIRLVAGGVEFIRLVEGTEDYVRFGKQIYLATDQNIRFEGSTADDFETILNVVDPTADRTITFPDATGTVALDDVATTSADGLMSSTDKTKLDGIETGADVTDATNVTAAGALMDSEVTNLAQVKAFDSSDYATAAQGTTADAALARSGGTMTGAITFAAGQSFDGRDVSADGSKLDGIESGATGDQTNAEIRAAVEAATDSNVFTDADHSKLNGIEAGATGDQTNAEIRAAVEAATDSNVFTDADHSKLNGIEASADVTDTTNVTAAGALMDSEVTNLAQVKAFDSSDYATAAQGTTADNALPKAGGTMTGAITFDASQTFDASDLTGTLPAIDGSNLTNVTAASVEVTESADDNVTYNILFSDTSGTGNVQMTPTQDDGGLTYNPSNDTLTTFKIQVADSIVHRDDTNTYIDFGSDEIRLVAGGVEFIRLVEGTSDYVRFGKGIYLTTDQNISFEGSTADSFQTTLYVVDPTADRTILLPDATGTIALDTVATTSADGLMSSSDKTKLDGIEASADVTDTTNVTAAGALMDSEVTNLAQVKSFDSSDYATAAQGTTADAALPKAGGTMTGSITFDASQTFDAADLTGTLPAIDGSNLTNVAASTIEVVESSDTNAFYPLLFASNNGSGNVQKSVVQDKDGSFINLSFNPSTNTFVTNDAVLYGDLKFHGATVDSNLTTLTVTDPTANRTITLPNATGTVALDDVATTSAAGLMSSSDKTKLDGIEAGADVTDTANVTAAGALMDSEVTNLAQVKAFDSSDYATASHNHDDRYYTETEADSRFLRSDASDTMTGNLTVDNGTSTTLSVKCDDGGNALVRANGDSQGTGALEVGQSNSYGGGISYNGDNSPAFVSGESADNITFYRLENGTRTEVFHYPYNSNTVNFNGSITLGGTVDGRDVATDGTKLDGIEASADVTDTTNVTAAGALMDSELTDIASVKALNQGVATTDSPTFAAITIDGHTLQNSTNRSGLLQVDTDLGTWNGFSIASTGTSHWSIMGDQDDFGLYDDVNNEWIMLYNENSTLQLYSNGSNGLTVSSTGILLPINKYIQFEGSTNDSFETALTVADPTADRTITLPDADGTVWTSGNDGSGSGLDADLLDGQQGSYYLDYNNLTNTPAAGGSVALTAGIANFIGR